MADDGEGSSQGADAEQRRAWRRRLAGVLLAAANEKDAGVRESRAIGEQMKQRPRADWPADMLLPFCARELLARNRAPSSTLSSGHLIFLDNASAFLLQVPFLKSEASLERCLQKLRAAILVLRADSLVRCGGIVNDSATFVAILDSLLLSQPRGSRFSKLSRLAGSSLEKSHRRKRLSKILGVFAILARKFLRSQGSHILADVIRVIHTDRPPEQAI